MELKHVFHRTVYFAMMIVTHVKYVGITHLATFTLIFIKEDKWN
jgi:hypothetical protein